MATMAWTAFCTGTVYAQEWIDVTDTYITNADFSTGTTDGWDAGTALPGVNATWLNAEFFQSYNSASQNVLGLKAGHYKLTVQGFHRAGGNDNGAAYNAGTEVINAYLFAGKDSVKLKSLYSEPADASVANQLNGWPDGMEGLNAWLTKYPESYLNEVTFTVQQDGSDMLMGIASNTNAGKTWSCWDNFKLYFEGSAFDAFSVKISKLETLRDSLETLGIASASELTALVEQYGSYNENTPEEEIAAASVILEENTATALGLCTKGAELTASMAKATGLLTQMEDGTYNVTDAVKQELQDAIGTAEEVLKLSTMKEVTEAIGDGITAMNTATSNAMAYISLSYSLQKAKALADRISGLAETEAYKKVAELLASTELVYDDVALAAQALNAECRTAMTPEFLSTASDDNPIELTSFIVNPNVFQTVSEMAPPSGWDCDKGAADGTWYTSTEGTGNSDLFCNSWTGSRLNPSRYGQTIGNDEEGAVKLPDGLYILKAATYTNAGATNVLLYASTDSVDFAFAESNEDWDTYVEARDALATTTETENFEVRDGKLHIGMVCVGTTGGNGKSWYADEFTELLKMECVEAMTQDVKESAKENPLDMTSFIVNPNIYQNAVDDNNTPINTVANGWECQTTADSQERTKATSGDTWLYCWSWSGKESNNIASSTDYHQVLGNYGAQESKVALPDGAYRLEAATWCTKTPELLQLYALTRNVSTEIVPDINQNDSTVYVFSDSVYAEAAFNADTDTWDIAQNTLSTTTVIPEIYVENGSLVIGIKGSGVITGNGQYWFADNFRLYYVGPNKGDNISAPAMDNNDLMKEVDVYDLSGRMVRKQVRKSEALRGLHKGIYIMDGKKYVVK